MNSDEWIDIFGQTYANPKFTWRRSIQAQSISSSLLPAQAVLRSLGVSAGVSLPLELELGNYIPSAIATHIPAYRRRHIGHSVQGVYLLCVRSPLMQPPLP